jgi:hypothetical protein
MDGDDPDSCPKPLRNPLYASLETVPSGRRKANDPGTGFAGRDIARNEAAVVEFYLGGLEDSECGTVGRGGIECLAERGCPEGIGESLATNQAVGIGFDALCLNLGMSESIVDSGEPE